MLIRISIIAAVLVLSGCSSNSPSNQTVGPINSVDGDQTPVDTSFFGDEIETLSGLRYRVITPAEGPKPSAQSGVTLNYIGTLTDGTVFDSSYERGEPSTFALNGTIEGFKEGVQLMSVGSKYRFTMPAELAYGDQGSGDIVGPGDTLIFEVELLEINSN